MNKLIGKCGLDCEKCEARIATITNDMELKEKVARDWSMFNGVDITPEMINCEGCNMSGAKTDFCANQCEIRKCAVKRGLSTCAECSQKKICETLATITNNNAEALNFVSDELVIKKLDLERYEGVEYDTTYESNGYYDIKKEGNGFTFNFVETEKEERNLHDEMISSWIERPISYGAYMGAELLGYAEGSIESWNNRFRISNIVIFEKENRYKKIGTALFKKMLEQAILSNARMIFLETQSSNPSAIKFYEKMGMEIIGFDMYAYSNNPEDTHEVVVWMGKKLVL